LAGVWSDGPGLGRRARTHHHADRRGQSRPEPPPPYTSPAAASAHVALGNLAGRAQSAEPRPVRPSHRPATRESRIGCGSRMCHCSSGHDRALSQEVIGREPSASHHGPQARREATGEWGIAAGDRVNRQLDIAPALREQIADSTLYRLSADGGASSPGALGGPSSKRPTAPRASSKQQSAHKARRAAPVPETSDTPIHCACSAPEGAVSSGPERAPRGDSFRTSWVTILASRASTTRSTLAGYWSTRQAGSAGIVARSAGIAAAARSVGGGGEWLSSSHAAIAQRGSMTPAEVADLRVERA
jgi:hypothetical protein